MLPTWVIGAMINVTGSIAINFGTNLLKFSHNQNVARPKAKKSYRSHTWLFGFSVFVLGNLCNFVSFGFAAQSLLAGLGSVQFITNVVFAHCVLGERITRRVLFATSMIVAGNTLIVTFANQSSKTYSGGELFDLYKTKTFIIYFITLAALLIVLQLLYKRLVKQRRHNHPHLIPFIYAMVSGIIGTQSVLLAKSVSTLLRTTLAGNNQLGSPFLYVVLVAWAVTMVFWLYRMNKALIMFDGVFIIPMLQVVWILFSVLGGGIYFQEFAGFSASASVFFSGGVGLVMCGVYFLAPNDHSAASRPHELRQNSGLGSGQTISDFSVSPVEEERRESSSSDELRQLSGRHMRNNSFMSTENILALFSQNVMFDSMEKEYDWSGATPEKVVVPPQSEPTQKPELPEVRTHDVDEEERENLPPQGQLPNERQDPPMSPKMADVKPEGENSDEDDASSCSVNINQLPNDDNGNQSPAREDSSGDLSNSSSLEIVVGEWKPPLARSCGRRRGESHHFLRLPSADESLNV